MRLWFHNRAQADVQMRIRLFLWRGLLACCREISQGDGLQFSLLAGCHYEFFLYVTTETKLDGRELV